MSDLQEAIETATRKVKGLLVRNGYVGEENTKKALIDPILLALGWDIHDLDEVQNEYKYKPQSNPVDYAFFIGGERKLFLEAKPLGTNLRDHKPRSQAVNYANTAGVEWCVLTDGNHWDVYKSTAPVDLDRKLFLETWLYSREERTPPFDASEVLGLLSKDKMAHNTIANRWKELYVDKTAERTLLGMVFDKDPKLVSLLVRRSELTRGEVEALMARAKVTIETSPVKPPPPPPVKPREGKTPRGPRKPLLVPGLPPEKRILVPLLRAIVKRGGEVNVRQQAQGIDEELADELGVTIGQRRVTFPGRKEEVWSNRVRWARQRLVNDGDLDGTRRGIWAITEQGRRRVEREG